MLSAVVLLRSGESWRIARRSVSVWCWSILGFLARILSQVNRAYLPNGRARLQPSRRSFEKPGLGRSLALPSRWTHLAVCITFAAVATKERDLNRRCTRQSIMADLHICSPKGFRASGVHAGIKTKSAPDVGLIVSDLAATAAAVFTTNKVVAAPVGVGRENVAGGKLHGIVVNAGNANACTGKQGMLDARRMCHLAGIAIGCDERLVLPSSTGIIGHLLPMEKMERGIAHAGHALGRDREHSLHFSDAILTTDLKRKEAATRLKIGRERVTLAGVCKGSGMIGPRMALPQATMLAYLTTDAAISPALLRKV